MSAERVWEETTLGQLYESGRKKLEESGVPDAALDTRLLLLEAFDLNFASFLTRRDQPLFIQAIGGEEEIYRLKHKISLPIPLPLPFPKNRRFLQEQRGFPCNI